MINLIPNEEKKKMVLEFYRRLFALSLIMLGVVMFAATFAILPSYILVRAKDNFVSEKLSLQSTESIPILDQATFASIQDLDAKLTLIESLKHDRFIVSAQIIDEILESKVAGIKITRISYVDNGLENRKIDVAGTASSRESLLSFRQALEQNPALQNVDLPISNFVRGSNIPFSLSLSPKPD